MRAHTALTSTCNLYVIYTCEINSPYNISLFPHMLAPFAIKFVISLRNILKWSSIVLLLSAAQMMRTIKYSRAALPCTLPPVWLVSSTIEFSRAALPCIHSRLCGWSYQSLSI